jgi:hypothetical protein
MTSPLERLTARANALVKAIEGRAHITNIPAEAELTRRLAGEADVVERAVLTLALNAVRANQNPVVSRKPETHWANLGLSRDQFCETRELAQARWSREQAEKQQQERVRAANALAINHCAVAPVQVRFSVADNPIRPAVQAQAPVQGRGGEPNGLGRFSRMAGEVKPSGGLTQNYPEDLGSRLPGPQIRQQARAAREVAEWVGREKRMLGRTCPV